MISVDKLEKDEDTKKEFNALKGLYDSLPLKRRDIFNYSIDWEMIDKNNIVENKIRPLVAKSIRELLGVEDDIVIDLIVKKVASHCSAQDMLDKTKEFLEGDAEKFVIKTWRALIFEQVKVLMNSKK